MTPLEIIAAFDAAVKLLELLEAAAARSRERGEWTANEEAAFERKKQELMAKPYWLPRK